MPSWGEGIVEFFTLSIMPDTVFGYEMFNYFFTLIMVHGLLAFGFGSLVNLLRR